MTANTRDIAVAMRHEVLPHDAVVNRDDNALHSVRSESCCHGVQLQHFGEHCGIGHAT